MLNNQNNSLTSCAISHPNIAFIKYWGNKNESLRIPENGSISMNLDSLWTKTKIEFDSTYTNDQLKINDKNADKVTMLRVSSFLDYIRNIANVPFYAKISSESNFPIGAGIASSASAFSALAVAAVNALNLNLSERELSIIARKGSGSASRSIPGGFVEWVAGDSDTNSFSYSICPPDHWDLNDIIAIVKSTHKEIGSTQGHPLAKTSPLQSSRVSDSQNRLSFCKNAILEKDFDKLAYISELDSNLLHAVMMTSTPILFYWEPDSLRLMKEIIKLRKNGIPVFYTLDAGPNVHVITSVDYIDFISNWLLTSGFTTNILISKTGGSAQKC